MSNGIRISVLVGLLAIFGQLAVVVWGASNLSARVQAVEVDHVEMNGEIHTLQDTVANRGTTIGVIAEKVDNIDKNVERLLTE
jgi:hypothetical protein